MPTQTLAGPTGLEWPLRVAEGFEAVELNVRRKIRFLFGEYYIDETDGTNWLLLLRTTRDPQLIARRAISVIQTAEGVERIQNVEVNVTPETRNIILIIDIVVEDEVVHIEEEVLSDGRSP